MTLNKYKYKVIALYGKSAAGKDTVLKATVKSNPHLNPIISCTTRPPRQGEVDGVDYHFLTDDEVMKLVVCHQMLEITQFRGWYYGTPLSSLDITKFNIGVFNPEGIIKLQQRNDIDLIKIEVYAPDKIRLIRSLNRETNPDCEEICRRFMTDKTDWEKHQIEFDYDFWNLDDEPNQEQLNLFNYDDVIELLTNKGWLQAKIG